MKNIEKRVEYPTFNGFYERLMDGSMDYQYEKNTARSYLGSVIALASAFSFKPEEIISMSPQEIAALRRNIVQDQSENRRIKKGTFNCYRNALFLFEVYINFCYGIKLKRHIMKKREYRVIITRQKRERVTYSQRSNAPPEMKAPENVLKNVTPDLYVSFLNYRILKVNLTTAMADILNLRSILKRCNIGIEQLSLNKIDETENLILKSLPLAHTGKNKERCQKDNATVFSFIDFLRDLHGMPALRKDQRAYLRWKHNLTAIV